MEKTGLRRLALHCLGVITAAGMFYASNGSAAFGKNIESEHTAEPAPTRSLMRVISSHTSKILDAIMVGDHNAVINESNAVAKKSKELMKDFFPAGGQVGEWFTETGKNPKNPDDVKAVKQDFEKYLKTVIDAANNIAETSKKQNIVETYKSLDAMLKNACFTCHEAARPKWPEWPEWMKITGG
ncbi:MAG: cytochrome c [Candidatus Brocadia sp.]|nr:cytochrome c [Candidatus Brocadia sp.]